jgi:hypothetical protein
VIAAALLVCILVFIFKDAFSPDSEALLEDLVAEPPSAEVLPEEAPVPPDGGLVPAPDPAGDGEEGPRSPDDGAVPEPASPEGGTAEPGDRVSRADVDVGVATVRDSPPRPTAPEPVSWTPSVVLDLPSAPPASEPASRDPEPAFEPAPPEETPAPTPARAAVPEPAFVPGASESTEAASATPVSDRGSAVLITVDSRPPGARLTIGGTFVGRAPHGAWGEPGEILEISASLEGYLKTTRLYRVGDEADSALIELSPEPSGDGANEADLGKLVVTSNPWAYVTIDGRQLGRVTPVTLDLRPGLHTIVLDNPDSGWTETRVVTITAGETVSLDISK